MSIFIITDSLNLQNYKILLSVNFIFLRLLTINTHMTRDLKILTRLHTGLPRESYFIPSDSQDDDLNLLLREVERFFYDHDIQGVQTC